MQKLEVLELKQALNKLCKLLNDLYNINNGGCCIVAYMIATHLDKLHVKYKLIVYDDVDKDEQAINSEVRNMVKGHLSNNSVVGVGTCDHYCLQLRGAGIINKGGNPYKKYTIEGVRASHIKWLYEKGIWNKDYDTENTKIIRNMLNAFFMKYERK